MKRPRSILPQVDYADLGFDLWSVKSEPFRALHCHNELELGVTEQGLIKAMFGHEMVDIPPDRLVVFWAITPHGPIEVAPHTRVHSLFVPLPWVLQWRLPDALIQRLLAGGIILDQPRQSPCSDIELLRSWSALMQSGTADAREIVLLQVHARLRQLALDGQSQVRVAAPPAGTQNEQLAHFATMARYIALNCREAIGVTEVARAAGLHPVYAMVCFAVLATPRFTRRLPNTASRTPRDCLSRPTARYFKSLWKVALAPPAAFTRPFPESADKRPPPGVGHCIFNR